MLIEVISLPRNGRSVNMKDASCGVTVLLLAAFLSKSKAAFNEYKQESYDGGNYKVMWKYDLILDAFTFNVNVKTTAWIGFGVSKNKGGMMGYDVMVGGMRANTSYGKDYYTTSQRRPSPDASQDYKLMSASEMNGDTSMMFYRKRDTMDTEKDVVIMPGQMYLIWAYGAADVPNNGLFSIHTRRGTVAYEFIDAAYAIVKLSDNYRLYWKYDKPSEMFYFTVVVNAAGWVAFGVSNQRGGMNGYDVMVGGVYSNKGYIYDYLTKTTSKPPKDVIQDYMLDSHEERDGYTVLSFHRKRNTGDTEGDVEIKPGEMSIVWAYSETQDVMNGDFPQHDRRGGMPYTFIEAPTTTANTAANTATDTAAHTAGTIAEASSEDTTCTNVTSTVTTTVTTTVTVTLTVTANTTAIKLAKRNGSPALYIPSICGIIAIFMFHRVIGT